MSRKDNPKGDVSIQPDTLAMKEKAQKEGLETMWDRLQAQEPQCGFCSLGLSCRNCVMGSWVDNTRIVNLAAILANALGVDLDQLPVAAAAPEWYSEKAATIAC
jgi:hydroxylamine reductase (hybrid-cluster protein)